MYTLVSHFEHLLHFDNLLQLVWRTICKVRNPYPTPKPERETRVSVWDTNVKMNIEIITCLID